MARYVDDSGLEAILRESTDLVSALNGQIHMTNEEMLARAKRLAASTEAYAGTGSQKVTHFAQKKAEEVKSNISLHLEVLKKTASRISRVKEKINSTKGQQPRQLAIEGTTMLDGKKLDGKLGEYDQKIDSALKSLTADSQADPKIVENIQKFKDIMANVKKTLKEIPKAIKNPKLIKIEEAEEAIDEEKGREVTDKTEDFLRRICEYEEQENANEPFLDGYCSDEEDEKIGDWAKYEGFNSKEDLDTFNESYKESVGEYPDEDMERSKEAEPELDEAGDFINKYTKKKPNKQTNRRLESQGYSETRKRNEAIKRAEELEKKVRQIMSISRKGGDASPVTLTAERKFMDQYLERKLHETIHTSYTATSQGKSEATKATPNTKKVNTTELLDDKKKGILTHDGPSKKINITEDIMPKDIEGSSRVKTPKKSKKKTEKSEGYVNEKKMDENLFDVPKPNVQGGSSLESGDENKQPIYLDMERIRKLVLKERQESLRKKREAWERNNELSERVIVEKNDLGLVNIRENPKPSKFEVELPNSKPTSSDFISEREKRERLYRNAVKNREGIFHKEDLDYEFGVHPMYNDNPVTVKTKDGKTIKLKGYSGVRKKNET